MADARAKFSEVESRRFGFRICRAVFDRLDPKAIVDAIFEEKPDVLIFRFPIEQLGSASCLDEIGMPWFIGDVLVYYVTDLTRYVPNAFINKELQFTEYTHHNCGVMDSLIPEVFDGYENHYCNNPIFEANLSDIYREWVRTFIGGRSEEKAGWIIERNGSPVGFVVCEFKDDEGEIVLGGITPSGRGGGVYKDLIRFAENACGNAGCKKVKISTQLSNKVVQRVWVGEGFVLDKSLMTIHVNSLLHTTAMGSMDFQMNELIDDYRGIPVGRLNDRTECVWDGEKCFRTSEEEMINSLALRSLPRILGAKNLRVRGWRSKVFGERSD